MRKFVLFLTLFTIFGANFADITAKGDERPVTDQETLADLTKSVGDHLKKLESQGKLELVEILSATHQTVAGSKYKIFAKLNENGTPANCTIKVWQKPWAADFLKFDVVCCENIRKYSFAEGVEAERLRDDDRFGVNGDGSVMSQETLNGFIPKITDLFSQFSDDYPDFKYALKRVVRGRPFDRIHAKFQVEVTLKDHADQTKQCYIIYFENVELKMAQAFMDCEDDKKKYQYEKN